MPPARTCLEAEGIKNSEWCARGGDHIRALLVQLRPVLYRSIDILMKQAASDSKCYEDKRVVIRLQIHVSQLFGSPCGSCPWTLPPSRRCYYYLSDGSIRFERTGRETDTSESSRLPGGLPQVGR
jgi:hypothetical protein